MLSLLDRQTVLIVFSALIMAVLCILPGVNNTFPIWIIASGASIADTMFHELGHSITGWLLGVPNIPAILTIFGRDQAAGFTLSFGHSWLLQGVAIVGLLCLCYHLFRAESGCLYPALTLTLLVPVIAISGYYEVAVSYMGHGGALLMGTFFLYRAWLYMDARNLYERWLNAFFGLFLILNNMYFAYRLMHDADFHQDYSDHVIGGVGNNDFVQMTEHITAWTVHGIAMFTLVLGGAMIVISFVASTYEYNSD